MKIIENNWNQSKEVVYKGNTLIVPIWANWVAISRYGSVVAFEDEPYIECDWWEELSLQGEELYIGRVEFEQNEDWKQSLEYVGND